MNQIWESFLHNAKELFPQRNIHARKAKGRKSLNHTPNKVKNNKIQSNFFTNINNMLKKRTNKYVNAHEILNNVISHQESLPKD
jgi:hypothetical protein